MVYLFVKRHRDTGLHYFGKTATKDPYVYNGSGVYWLRHLKKHGHNVETVQVWHFDCIDTASTFALEFSKTNCVVESSKWANLIDENAKDGSPGGISYLVGRTYEEIFGSERAAQLRRDKADYNRSRVHTKESRVKRSLAIKGRKHTEETIDKMRRSSSGKRHSEETKQKIAASQRARIAAKKAYSLSGLQ